MSLENVIPLMTEYAELKDEAAAINARIKELDPQIRPALEGAGLVTVDDHTFTCVMTAGRKSLDKKAMEADGIDLEPYYKVGAPFTTLTVKKVQ